MSQTHPQLDVTIKDFMFTSTVNKSPDGKVWVTGKGEFGLDVKKVESPEALDNRIFAQIKDIIYRVAELAKMDPGNKNLVQRGITNELFFYGPPLPLDRFERIMQRVVDIAKQPDVDSLLAQHPDAFAFIFGTFPVQTPTNRLMNAAVHIEWGKNPKLKLIVKSNPHRTDPALTLETAPNELLTLHNAAAKEVKFSSYSVEAVKVSDYSIQINGETVPFSYNTVVGCKTAGNIPYLTLVEICRDHSLNVGKNNLFAHHLEAFDHEMKESPPFLCNHVVISNSIHQHKESSVGALISHCDPQCESPSYTINTTQVRRGEIKFGTEFFIKEKNPLHTYRTWNDVFMHLVTTNQIEKAKRFLEKHKQNMLPYINDPTATGESPLIAALATGNLQLAQLLVDEFKADCASAAKFFVNSKELPELFFKTGMQVAQFREALDIHSIADKGSGDYLCDALAAGVEFKLDSRKIFMMFDEKSAPCAKLLTDFDKIKQLAAKMSSPIKQADNLAEQINQFFLSQKNKGLNFPRLWKKTTPVLSEKESKLCAEIKAKPENAVEYVNTLIREILAEHLQRIKEKGAMQFAEPKFLQNLLCLQKGLIVKKIGLVLPQHQNRVDQGRSA